MPPIVKIVAVLLILILIIPNQIFKPKKREEKKKPRKVDTTLKYMRKPQCIIPLTESQKN
jgi:hypothetical protein